MKKLLIVLIMSVALVGCSDAVVNVTNPKETAITVGDVSFSREHLFSLLKNQDPATLVVEMAKRKILDEKQPVDDDIRAKAQEELDYVKEVFGDSFSNSLAAYGFSSEEEYLEKALIPNAQEVALVSNFINENFDLMITTYNPKQVRIIEFTEITDATEALQAIRDGENVEEVAERLSNSLSYNGTLRLVHTETSLPSEVKDFITQNEVPTLTANPIEDANSGRYYVVQIIEVNPSRFQEETIEELSNLNSINEMMFIDYFEQGNFNVYDKTIFDAMMQSYRNYLPNR